jgi:hypothetical protein
MPMGLDQPGEFLFLICTDSLMDGVYPLVSSHAHPYNSYYFSGKHNSKILSVKENLM